MTSFANPAIYQCPECSGYLLRSRPRSLNSYGARFWSDGYSTMAGSSASAPLVRCAWCAALFWFKEVVVAGELPPQPIEDPKFGWFSRLIFRLLDTDEDDNAGKRRVWIAAPAEWRAAKYGDAPGSNDLVILLGGGSTLDLPREIHVRRQLWWHGNDHQRRYASNIPQVAKSLIPSSGRTANMKRLLELAFDISLETGEVLRQMGRFDEAINVLSAINVNAHTIETAQMLAGFTRVRELRADKYQW